VIWFWLSSSALEVWRLRFDYRWVFEEEEGLDHKKDETNYKDPTELVDILAVTLRDHCVLDLETDVDNVADAKHCDQMQTTKEETSSITTH